MNWTKQNVPSIYLQPDGSGSSLFPCGCCIVEYVKYADVLLKYHTEQLVPAVLAKFCLMKKYRPKGRLDARAILLNFDCALMGLFLDGLAVNAKLAACL